MPKINPATVAKLVMDAINEKYGQPKEPSEDELEQLILMCSV
jgi:hypothetical protein